MKKSQLTITAEVVEAYLNEIDELPLIEKPIEEGEKVDDNLTEEELQEIDELPLL